MRRRLRSPHSRSPRRIPSRHLPGYQPRLERLEDRTLPSVNPILHLHTPNLGASSLAHSPQPSVPDVTPANLGVGQGATVSLTESAEPLARAPGKSAEAHDLDVSVGAQGTNPTVVAEVSLTIDGNPRFSVTVSLTVSANPSVGGWSFSLTVDPGFGAPNGNASDQAADVGQVLAQQNANPSANGGAANADPTAFNPASATPPQSSVPGQQPAAVQGTTTAQGGEANSAGVGVSRPFSGQQAVLVVPIVIVNEVPLFAAIDLVGPVLPPGPSVLTVAPLLPTFQTANRIQSGGGDNLPLPDKHQLYNEMLNCLINGWWVQQPGPALNPDIAALSVGLAGDAQAVTDWQQAVEGALGNGEDRVTEKKAPDSAPDADGPGRDGTSNRPLAGAAILALVLGGYWGRYADESDSDKSRRWWL